MPSVTVNAQREMSKNMFLDKAMTVADMTEFEQKKFEGCIKYVESEHTWYGVSNGTNVQIGKGAGSGDTIITYVKNISGSDFSKVTNTDGSVDYYKATIPASVHGLKIVINGKLVDASYFSLDVEVEVNEATKEVMVITYSQTDITGNYNLILYGVEA